MGSNHGREKGGRHEAYASPSIRLHTKSDRILCKIPYFPSSPKTLDRTKKQNTKTFFPIPLPNSGGTLKGALIPIKQIRLLRNIYTRLFVIINK